MADLSKGTGDGSVLAGHRVPLFWPSHSQGDTKVTSPAVTELANAEPITKAANRAGNRAPFTAVNQSGALTPHQHRSWRRGSSAAFLALLLPVAGGPLPSGYKAGTPSVPCPRRARNSEVDTCGRRATIA